jgi:hypothetical protein
MTYKDRIEYRRPRPGIARLNRWVARLAVLGLTPPNTIALEVPGRRTGKLRRTPIIRAYLSKRAYSKSPEFEAREFFGVSPTATLDELAEIAPRYPVFRIVTDPGGRRVPSRTSRPSA